MPKLDMYNTKGEVVGNIDVSDELFAAEINESALHEVVKNYLANQRQGTQSTKTRTEVRGGGRKPWRQKGTGRARQGSIRSPQWTGGGVALGPKPRSYRYSINKKLKRIALKSALSSKVATSNIIVLDALEIAEIKTKLMVEVLTNLNIDTKALIVLPSNDDKVYKSTKNIPGVTTITANTINVYEILKHTKMIATADAIKKLEEVYA